MARGISRAAAVAGLLAAIVIVAGCASATQSASPTLPSAGPSYVPIDSIPVVPAPTTPPWFGVEMTDVTTGKAFKISDFAGKVILVDTMAVWCPTCQGEMSQVQQLPALLGTSSSDLVRISLDVDPNEDTAILSKFAATNKFDWYIAVAPIEVGRSLATNYDQQYLNPPLQPMLFIDKAGGVYGLPFGIKSAVSIQKTLAEYLAQ
jgi:cytochrome oxidase Cu insertion factor (SCO1/SenC/PrrC family)